VSALSSASPAVRRPGLGATLPSVAPGLVTTYLSLIVLLPLAAVFVKSTEGGWETFWTAVSSPDAVAALKVTLGAAAVVCAINGVFGTIIAWVLVRDDFRGKGAINSIIDLPFALPTIVAGLVLLTLYGPQSPLGLNAAYTRIGIVLALLFETLPFVVRSVQPVLIELDRESEEAASSLGAKGHVVFRRIILPTILPALLSGVALGFARAIGEFGSIVLISGNIPFDTEVASVHIFALIESDRPVGAAGLAVVLLSISLAVLVAINLLQRWSLRHDR
jgi:sulfate transport system permease protein